MFHEKGVREHTAICLKRQFKDCFNIDCELGPQPWNSHFNKMTQGNFQMGLMHWNQPVDDLIYTLNSFKTTKQELNFAKWENPKFQHYLELCEQQINPFQRSLYLLHAEETLCEETPIIPLFFQPSQTLMNKDLKVSYQKPFGPFNISKSYYRVKNEQYQSYHV